MPYNIYLSAGLGSVFLSSFEASSFALSVEPANGFLLNLNPIVKYNSGRQTFS